MHVIDKKTKAIASLIKSNHSGSIENILVVGCGSGIEAAVLHQELGAKVIGIDTLDNFNEAASAFALLKVGDARKMEFGSGSFDFVYSFHALEHIEQPQLALAEISRVLRKGGGYWIGTPNRSRIVAYIGSREATLPNKIVWNLADYWARIRGRFRNEYGAHAGFAADELRGLLLEHFDSANDFATEYYLAVYPNHKKFIQFIKFLGASWFIYPCVYFMGSN